MYFKFAKAQIELGVSNFEQFLLQIRQQRIAAKLGELSVEELEIAKQAWREAEGAKTSKAGEASPKGKATKINSNLDEATRRSLIRENESAEILAKNGYDIEQNPSLPQTNKNPDYLINGKVFDNYSPSTNNARNIATNIEKKVLEEQTDLIVLNLYDSAVELSKLTKQLKEYPIKGLREILIIKDNQVMPFYPF